MFDPSKPNQRPQPTDWSDRHFETRAIRSGQDPDPTTGSVTIPLNMASTYRHDALGQFKGYEYGRTGNPTRTALEDLLASLEEASWALCYASGTAAAQNVTWLTNPGDEILLSDDIYSGTYRFLVETLGRYGVTTTLVDFSDLDATRAAISEKTKLVWVETPTNPNLKVTDIAAIAGIVKASSDRAKLVVDNTFATPYLQQPLALGADIVMYSTTKYIGGHSDVVGGAITGNDPEIGAFLKDLQNAAGAVPSPFDCWLTVRGLKTLAVRMDRHSANALAVATWLEAHPAIRKVFYPGLPSHPGHEIAKRQMQRGFGGMVSFEVNGGFEQAKKLVEGTKLFLLAESLGGVESLIEHPAQMTHISVADTGVAVNADLIRMSVGIEHVDDLIADLEQALS
ncbi:MAG: cystathionine gamma-synthase [Thermomicrobiales bacterium]